MIYWLIGILLVISGISKSVKDTVRDHYYGSIFSKLNQKYWNGTNSWLNKYDQTKFPDLKPKFWGSTTFLAWTTDAWHLFDTIQSTCLQLAISIPISILLGNLWLVLPVIALTKILVGVPFEITYSKLFVKKK